MRAMIEHVFWNYDDYKELSIAQAVNIEGHITTYAAITFCFMGSRV
jgi:hypothetical protein